MIQDACFTQSQLYLFYTLTLEGSRCEQVWSGGRQLRTQIADTSVLYLHMVIVALYARSH